MKALFIEPRARSITEIDLEDAGDGGAADICRRIDCDLFNTVRSSRDMDGGGDIMYVDDMGMYRQPLYCNDIFSFTGYPIPLIGNAVVVGCDSAGESVDVSSSVEEMTRRITFIPRFCPEVEFDCEYLEDEAEEEQEPCE